MHRTVRTLVAMVLLGALGLAPPAQAADDGRRLLIGAGSLVDGGGVLKSRIPVATAPGSARFSPDGTMLAYSAGSGRVGIQHADGSTDLLAPIPYFGVESVTWDPDQDRVAVLGQYVEPGSYEQRIYLVPLDGSSPVKVYDDTPTLRISVFRGLSWRSSDDTLAFIATEFSYDGGSGLYFATNENSDQVWTIPASPEATPTRLTGRPSCQGCESFPAFRSPTWSPDGSRLAVLSGDEGGGFVGYLEPGDLGASRLADAWDGSPPSWSSDGEELSFATPDVDGDDATQGIYPDTRVVDADSGTTLATISDQPEQLVDRLPCPGAASARSGRTSTSHPCPP